MHFDESDCSLTQTLNDMIVAQKTIEQEIVIVFKSQTKIKLNKVFKSFKFEEFAINFNSSSTSMILCFESIIKSNVARLANSIFMSISKESRMTSIQFEEFDVEKTIVIAQKIKKQVVVAVIETAKSETCFKNIDFFDSTMQMNL